MLGDPNVSPLSPDFGLFGGPTGYRYGFRWLDWVYLISFIYFTRVLVIYASLRISYQKR